MIATLELHPVERDSYAANPGTVSQYFLVIPGERGEETICASRVIFIVWELTFLVPKSGNFFWDTLYNVQ